MTSQKNIVFGAGPLGLWVSYLLAEQGDQVTIVSRSGKIQENLPAKIESVAADASDPESVYEICKGAKTVFHCAMPPYTQWPAKFPPLTQGIVKGVTRAKANLIYADNLYGYGNTQGKPLREDLPYLATGPKGKVRADMAQRLLEAHERGDVKVAIGRGSDFYGPQVLSSTIGHEFFKAALSGKPVNLLGNVTLPHTYTYIKDFARALITLAESDRAYGQVWHVPNAPTVTTQQFVTIVQNEIGQPIKIRSAGRGLVTLLGLFHPMLKEAKEMMYEWEQPYIVDHQKFRATFGGDATPLETGIKETIAWHRH